MLASFSTVTVAEPHKVSQWKEGEATRTFVAILFKACRNREMS